jgi:hypothetical protein
LNLPRLDLQAAGLGWVEDARKAVQATEAEWADYLQALLVYHEELEGMLVASLNEDEEGDAKKVQVVMTRLERRLSGVQSLLSSFRAQHR